MMDAVEYLKEKKRMCQSVSGCSRCPLYNIDTLWKDHICPDIFCKEAEESVRIVEEWSKAHPKQTNADKFKEVFGVTPFNDLLEDYVCPPSTARGKTGCSLKRCDECSHSYWDMPYEAPKGDNNG